MHVDFIIMKEWYFCAVLCACIVSAFCSTIWILCVHKHCVLDVKKQVWDQTHCQNYYRWNGYFIEGLQSFGIRFVILVRMFIQTTHFHSSMLLTCLLVLLILKRIPLLFFRFIRVILYKVQILLSVVGIATGYGLDDRKVGVPVPVGSRIFSTSSRPALGSTQPPMQWVPGALSPGGKVAGA
jgi:hypothetical protein